MIYDGSSRVTVFTSDTIGKKTHRCLSYILFYEERNRTLTLFKSIYCSDIWIAYNVQLIWLWTVPINLSCSCSCDVYIIILFSVSLIMTHKCLLSSRQMLPYEISLFQNISTSPVMKIYDYLMQYRLFVDIIKCNSNTNNIWYYHAIFI